MRHVVFSRSIFLAATAAAGFAAESSGPTPTPPPAREDSINATRRDLDLIKSSRENATQPGGALPKFSVPDLQPAPSAGAWAPQKPGTPEKKSAHWLIEAMEKKADARKTRSKTDDERERSETENPLEAKTPMERERPERREGATEEKTLRAGEAVANPLARFMSDWMRPQDLALMKPVMDARAGEFSGTTRTGGAVSVSEFVLAPNADGISSLVGATKSMAASPAPENPYLQAMGPSITVNSALTANSAAPGPVLSSRQAPTLAPLPPPPPPKSSVPDFVRPATDEKYFKQLKRF